MDSVIINDLRVSMTIGVFDWEKKIKQDLFLDITLFCDLSTAGKSDLLKDTVDYDTFSKELTSHLENTPMDLIERVAEETAQRALAVSGVVETRVLVKKPGCISNAAGSAVSITRR